MNAIQASALFLAGVEALLGLLVLVGALRALRAHARRAEAERVESQRQFLFLAAWVLAGLAACAWPLLYVMLHDAVPLWRGILCIEGMTRIGSGSRGAAGLLPTLMTSLAVLRPLAVLLAGAWIVAHRVDRTTHTGALARRVFALLALAGLAGLLGGAAELAWLTIPKYAQARAAGCCSVATTAAATLAPGARAWAGPAFFALLPAACALALVGSRRTSAGMLAAGAVAAAACVPVAWVFASDVASPAVLHLPLHHCAWCLLERAPESIVAALLLAAAVGSAGWAAVAAWRVPQEVREAATDTARRALRRAAFCYAAVVLMALTALGAA